MMTFFVFVTLGAIALYLRKVIKGEDGPERGDLTEDKIKQEWRKLGFFCELDDSKRLWVLTGSRAGLLYFPDLLLGFVNDPQNAVDGSKQHYDPYGSLEIMTWRTAGFDAHAIRGSLDDLTRLAELVEGKLVTAEAGETITIRDEFAAESPYGLFLDVRADGFDPSSADRERLGATAKPVPKPG